MHLFIINELLKLLIIIKIMLGSLDFLPPDFNPLLKAFIYIMIILHILAFVVWCVLACPSILSRRETFSDQVDKMMRKNKEKNL